MLHKLKYAFIITAVFFAKGSLAQGLPPGWDFTITSSFHIISIPLSSDPTINGESIASGDYIGIFFTRNDSLICGGASEWTGDENIAVIAYGDDSFTTVKDGFSYAEPFHWKIWSWDDEEAYDAEVQYNPAQPDSDGIFIPSGLSALLEISVVTGFYVHAYAEPDTICQGSSAQLSSVVGGGSGTYSYQWKSNPPGFFSELPNPIASPVESCWYIIMAYDQQDSIADSCYVEVILPPQPYAGNDTSICESAFFIPAASAYSYSALRWSSEGDGLFSDTSLLHPGYYPGSNDLANGSVVLILEAFPLGPCMDTASDQLLLSFEPIAFVEAGEDGSICASEYFQTSAYTENAGTIEWATDGDGSFNDPSSISAKYYPGEGDQASGGCRLKLNVSSLPPCNEIVTDSLGLTINALPLVDAGENQTIAYGESTMLNGSASGGSNSFDYLWSPAELLSQPNNPSTATLALTETTEFILTATDIVSTCSNSDSTIVYITGGPLSLKAIANPESICYGDSSQLYALPTGGSGTIEYYHWTSDPPGFESSLPNPRVSPAQSTTYTLEINDGISSAWDDVLVEVKPLPVVSAGADQDIPHGTYTTLHGSAQGGSGEYAYLWSPAGLLLQPDIPEPQTLKLYESQNFNLRVEDIISGCFDTDNTMVTVSGDPLSLSIAAEPMSACPFDEIQLTAQATGGSGIYTYQWWSEPTGFTANIPNPLAYPEVTTEYFVMADDGYNQISLGIKPIIYPVPDITINVFPDDTVCLNQSIELDATTEGALSYLWLPGGETTARIVVDTSTNGPGMSTLEVQVTNVYSCTSSKEISVFFDNCIGIQHIQEEHFHIYPIPADKQINIFSSHHLEKSSWEIFNIFGDIMLQGMLNANKQHNTINTSSLSPGFYLLIIQASGGSQGFKIIIQ